MRTADPYIAELERVALFAEIDRGLLPPSAARPALPHEHLAQVDFVEWDSILTAAYTATATILTRVRDLIMAAFRDLLDVGRVLSPTEVAARVLTFTTALPPDLRAQLDREAIDVGDVLLTAMAASGAALIGEARRQRVPTTTLTRAERDLDRRVQQAEEQRLFDPAAGTATLAVWQRLTQGATQLDGPRPPTSATAVIDAVAGTQIDAAFDLARQGTHVAAGEGRHQAADALPEPVDAYASELLDKATCDRCAQVDGRRYTTMADAEADYPRLGPYEKCLGGARCRGSIVILWGESRPSR